MFLDREGPSKSVLAPAAAAAAVLLPFMWCLGCCFLCCEGEPRAKAAWSIWTRKMRRNEDNGRKKHKSGIHQVSKFE